MTTTTQGQAPADTNTASGAAITQVLAYLDGLSDDAAAHIYPSDLEKCMTSECVVEVASVRAGNGYERTVPLFSREQVVAALASAAAPAEGPPVHSKEYLAAKYSAAALTSRGQARASAPSDETAMERTSDLASHGGRWPSDWVEAYRRGFADATAQQDAGVLEDAAMLDWLEKCGTVAIERCKYLGSDDTVIEVTPYNDDSYEGDTLRAAIDAAIDATRKQGGV